MFRTLLLAVSLVALAAVGSAQDGKAEKTNATGKFKTFKDGMLTIAVTPIKKGDEEKDASFKVPADLKCYVCPNGEKKENVPATQCHRAVRRKADRAIPA